MRLCIHGNKMRFSIKLTATLMIIFLFLTLGLRDDSLILRLPCQKMPVHELDADACIIIHWRHVFYNSYLNINKKVVTPESTVPLESTNCKSNSLVLTY